MSKKTCGGESIDRKLSWRVGGDWGDDILRGGVASSKLYLERAPGRCGLEAGPNLLHRLSTHRVAIGSRSTRLAETRRLLFLAPPLSHPTISRNWLETEEMSSLQCVSFSSKPRRRESQSVHGPVTRAESCVDTRRALSESCLLPSVCGKVEEPVRD